MVPPSPKPFSRRSRKYCKYRAKWQKVGPGGGATIYIYIYITDSMTKIDSLCSYANISIYIYIYISTQAPSLFSIFLHWWVTGGFDPKLRTGRHHKVIEVSSSQCCSLNHQATFVYHPSAGWAIGRGDFEQRKQEQSQIPDINSSSISFLHLSALVGHRWL